MKTKKADEQDATTEVSDPFQARILADARVALNNKNLSPEQILDWSSWENSLRAGADKGQVVVHLKAAGVFVVVDKSSDKR